MRWGRRRWWRWAGLGLAAAALLLFVLPALPSVRPSLGLPFDAGPTQPPPKDAGPHSALSQRILALSRDYVGRLAQEQAAVQDSPYGPPSAFDMKKTLAVLLQSLSERLDSVEQRLGNLSGLGAARRLEGSAPTPKTKPLSAKELVEGKAEECGGPDSYPKELWPACEKKVEWMRGFWSSDGCYAAHGVDGSECSFRVYLSEVERHCPRLPFRPALAPTPAHNLSATPNTRLDQLLALMSDKPSNYDWMKGRLRRLWPSWTAAVEELKSKAHWFARRKPRRILLHIGCLTKESGFKFDESAGSGGPLGELVQWSDLAAALFLLGHQLTISSDLKTFVAFAQADPALKSSCPVSDNRHHVDLIFTDIVGLRQMKKKIPGSLQNYKCRLRVLDSFGTQAEFNFPPYFAEHKATIGGSKKNAWGAHRLHLPQFYTMYPHSPDNTFLGFVVERFGTETTGGPSGNDTSRKDWALVYGKVPAFWKDKEAAVRVLREEGLEVHATVGGDASKALPAYVTNHGVLPGPELHRLLRQVRVFLGLGFPFEGPAPLEAIANGAVFVNPAFPKAKGRGTDAFFAEKPTLRRLSSQNPYAEHFIGAPFVETVELEDLAALREAVRRAKAARNPPHLPHEMTEAGMLERVGALVEAQDFCEGPRRWPPLKALERRVGEPGESCSDVCASAGLVCEPAWWRSVNRAEAAAELRLSCGAQTEESAPDAPLWTPQKCVLQTEPLLFSCASPPRPNGRRLCPCRDYVKDQVALCAACL